MDALLSYLCNRKSPGDILVIAPPHIADATAPDPLYRRYYEESRRMDAGFYRQAERYGTAFVDAGAWDIPLCFDKVHFSEKGHRIFAEKLGDYLMDSFGS